MALNTFLGRLRSTAERILGVDAEPLPRKETQHATTPSPGSSWPRNVEPPRATLKGLTWLGLGTTVRIGSGAIELHDPLAYFRDEAPRIDDAEPAAINLKLPIANNAQMPESRELPYWPRYDQLTPNQRRVYLNWLSHRRSFAPPELGYTFLFIYGLERRALLERQDVKLIFKELLRLRNLYQTSVEKVSRSFDRYTSSFLWYLLLCEPSVLAERHFEAFARSIGQWDEDGLAFALSWLARAKCKLPDWLAFALAGRLPKSQTSVVAKRVGNELHDLFTKRFQSQFNSGFVLQSAKRDRQFSYRPASAALSTMQVSGPDPMGVLSQFNSLSDIWNSCISDLKRLSSAVAHSEGGAFTVATWNAMPTELRTNVDHPLIDQFTRFIEEHTGDNPQTIVTARALATVAGAAPDAKLTTSASRRIAETAANVGYCIEPDPRITGRGFDPDESIVLFLNLDGGAVDAARYAVASTMLNIGIALAHLDGHVDEGKLSLNAQQIDSAFDLNDQERRRLDMLRALRTKYGVELSDVTRPLKHLPQTDRERIAKFSLALVAADGVVTKEELKAIRRLYAALGFDRNQADAELAGLTAKPSQDEEPVSVVAASAGVRGETIPTRSTDAAAKGLQLNREAINAILKDTSDVARMLAAAMTVETDDEPKADKEVPAAPIASKMEGTSASDPRLPSQYEAFFQSLLRQPQWSRAELSAIAKQQGLMLAGAVDAINQWSTETNGGPLLYEDGDQFSLESAYLS